ncbi:MAG TPA: hypothetical protein VF177_21175 [Anaerolineae bacterium]
MFEQDRVIVRLQQRVLAERDIEVCFLSGSYGRRRDDAYSDLDVALVFADEGSREVAWRNRRDFAQSVLPYVPAKSFDADHVRSYFHIALYSNGAKVDYRYEARNALLPNPWDRDIHILKDNQDGWGEHFHAASAQAPLVQERITGQQLEQIDDRFWVMFMDVFRLLLRGDHDKPFTIYLELLHFTLPPLLRVLPPEEPARPALLQAQFNRDMKATRRHLAQLLDAYLAARSAVIRRLDLAFVPNNAFETQIQRLVKRKA